MVRQTRREDAGPDEVIIEIAACGVCHTDLTFYYDNVPTRRPFPLALGHEISGRVVEAGAHARDWMGRSVVVPSVLPCGVCAACLAGRGQVCPTQIFPGSSVDGGFGTHIRLPSRGLATVPDLDDPHVNPQGLDLTALSVVADAVSTPYQAVVRSGLAPGDLAVWVGAGGLGGFGVQIASALGATVVAIDIDDERLSQSASAGAASTLNASRTDTASLRRAVRSFADARGIPTWRTVIFETSGQPAGQSAAFGLLGRGSVLSVVGYTATPIEVRLSNLMAYDATAQGNWGCLPELYPKVIDLVLSGRIRIEPFIERRPMREINDAFDAIHAGSVRKRVVLVDPT